MFYEYHLVCFPGRTVGQPCGNAVWVLGRQSRPLQVCACPGCLDSPVEQPDILLTTNEAAAFVSCGHAGSRPGDWLDRRAFGDGRRSDGISSRGSISSFQYVEVYITFGTCLKPDLVLCTFIFPNTGPPLAYPTSYRRLWLLRPSCLPRACGWLPALLWERASGRLLRSEDPFDVVLGRHFTPEFFWSGDTYAGTRHPEALSRLGLRNCRFRRLCLTTLLPCLHSSFTMTTCSTCRRVRLTAYRLSTLALRHLFTSHLP